MLLPTRYEIKPKDATAIAIDPIAKPSNPSVKFAALDEPIITTIANGI